MRVADFVQNHHKGLPALLPRALKYLRRRVVPLAGHKRHNALVIFALRQAVEDKLFEGAPINMFGQSPNGERIHLSKEARDLRGGEAEGGAMISCAGTSSAVAGINAPISIPLAA